MLELQAGGGLRGAAKQFYDRHRVVAVSVALSVIGLATGATTATAVLQRFALADAVILTAGVLLASAFSFLQLRHVVLAVITALAPVPGLLWAAPISSGSQFGPVPILAYGFGFACAALIAERQVEQALEEARHEHPWRAALASVVLMGVYGYLWCREPADATIQAVADFCLSACSAVLLMPLAISWLHFDEMFVARANRLRERRIRFFEGVAKVTVPRWAFSFAGIATIFLALGWFGAEPVIRDGTLLRIASVLLAIVTAGSVAGGWREGLAVAMVTSASCLIALWATVVDPQAPYARVGVLQITTFALFLALACRREVWAWRRRDDPPVVAERRTLERAAGVAFAASGGLVALLPAVLLWKATLVFVAGVLAAVLGSTVLVPAAVVALEVLSPRRRSVEELYGRRKKPLAH